MELPKNAGTIADKFEGLSKERKSEIISHLAQIPADKARATLDTLIKNGGKEGEFVALLFGRKK